MKKLLLLTLLSSPAMGSNIMPVDMNAQYEAYVDAETVHINTETITDELGFTHDKAKVAYVAVILVSRAMDGVELPGVPGRVKTIIRYDKYLCEENSSWYLPLQVKFIGPNGILIVQAQNDKPKEFTYASLGHSIRDFVCFDKVVDRPSFVDDVKP